MEWLFIYSIINLLLDLVILIFFLFLLAPVIRGAPYVPIRRDLLSKALELAEIKPNQKIADLGSGDGRILFEAAQLGAMAYGYEINPLLVWKTKLSIKKKGLTNSVFCFWGNFWSQDFSQYDTVFIYGITYIMKGLEAKLQKELKPGAKAIVFVFPFPTWPLASQARGVYVYQK